MTDIPIPILIVVVFFSCACIILGVLAFWKNKMIKRGIPLSVREMCAMSVKKTLTEDMLNALELASQNKFLVKPHYLEAHLIAGGNPFKLIQIIVNGKNEGVDITFREAATMELGKVSLEETKKLYADYEVNKNISSSLD